MLPSCPLPSRLFRAPHCRIPVGEQSGVVRRPDPHVRIPELQRLTPDHVATEKFRRHGIFRPYAIGDDEFDTVQAIRSVGLALVEQDLRLVDLDAVIDVAAIEMVISHRAVS